MQWGRDNHLTDPSQYANTFPSNCPQSSSSAPNGKCSYLPNLTDAERTLLRDNEGCFKCCHAFAGLHAFEGKCEAPNRNNYLLITQATIDVAKRLITTTQIIMLLWFLLLKRNQGPPQIQKPSCSYNAWDHEPCCLPCCE